MIIRKPYELALKAIDEKRIPIIMGIRRIGKTTILKQINKKFKDSLYISWDSFELASMSEIEFFQYIDSLCQNGGLLLFDEVQIRNNWDLIIKNMYDRYVVEGKCKIIVTGSSSMILRSKDLGVTRTEVIAIDTWDFDEFSQLVNVPKTLENFENFLGYGFPEFMHSRDDKTFKALLNLTLKPILENDIPKAYPQTDTLALMRFVKELAHLTNGEVNETSLSLKVGITNVTTRKYIDILEKAMLIRRVYLINESLTLPKKKRYKVYLNPHIHIWLLGTTFSELDNKAKGHIIESYWLTWATSMEGFNKTFYYFKDTKTNKEFDFVSLNNDGSIKTIHEFKYANKVDSSVELNLLKTKSVNKLIWGKETRKGNVKYISILDINNN